MPLGDLHDPRCPAGFQLGMIMLPKTQAPKAFEFFRYDSGSFPRQDEQELRVKRDAFWSYCGPLFHRDIPADFHDWAGTALSGSVLPLLSPLLQVVDDIIAERGLGHYWVTVRAITATPGCRKPRWHTDNLFFSPGGGGLGATPAATSTTESLQLHTDWKVCATLLGPPTMFIPLENQGQARQMQLLAKRDCSTDHACTSIRCIGCATAADAVRETLAIKLAELGVVQAAPGECALFRIGQQDGAVHSEPFMLDSCGRIFVNVIPGSREELSTLVSRWGMPFPRSWWVSPSIPRGR